MRRPPDISLRISLPTPFQPEPPAAAALPAFGFSKSPGNFFYGRAGCISSVSCSSPCDRKKPSTLTHVPPAPKLIKGRSPPHFKPSRIHCPGGKSTPWRKCFPSLNSREDPNHGWGGRGSATLGWGRPCQGRKARHSRARPTPHVPGKAAWAPHTSAMAFPQSHEG